MNGWANWKKAMVLSPTMPGRKMAAEKVATKPFIFMPQGWKTLSWSQDFFRTRDWSKQACIHSTHLPRQIGKKTKVFSTSYDKEASLGGLLRHRMECFPCRWPGSWEKVHGKKLVLLPRSLEGAWEEAGVSSHESWRLPHKWLPWKYRIAVSEFPAGEARKEILICDGPDLKREKCEG